MMPQLALFGNDHDGREEECGAPPLPGVGEAEGSLGGAREL